MQVFSAARPGADRANEDGVAVVPLDGTAGVIALADGMGGLPGGGAAARRALDCVVESVERARDSGDYLREAILDGFERANKAVLDLGIGAGTTLTVLEIRPRTSRTYHVGDSESLVVSQRGRVRYRTVPHTPVGYGVEAGLIGRREALHHAERHLLSNLVGSADMRIDIGPVIRPRARDVFLVASDGVWDNLHEGEITDRIRKGTLKRSASALLEAVRQRMSKPDADHPSKLDDLTFALFRRTDS